MPMHTSHDRQYQLSMLAQVGSWLTFCQLRTVRTIQHAAVIKPMLISAQRPALTLGEIWTFHKMKTGNIASIKSEIIDIKAWAIMILCSSPSLKQCPWMKEFQAAARGRH